MIARPEAPGNCRLPPRPPTRDREGGGGVLLVSVPADGGAKSGWDPPQEEERGKGKRSLATLANGLHG